MGTVSLSLLEKGTLRRQAWRDIVRGGFSFKTDADWMIVSDFFLYEWETHELKKARHWVRGLCLLRNEKGRVCGVGTYATAFDQIDGQIAQTQSMLKNCETREKTCPDSLLKRRKARTAECRAKLNTLRQMRECLEAVRNAECQAMTDKTQLRLSYYIFWACQYSRENDLLRAGLRDLLRDIRRADKIMDLVRHEGQRTKCDAAPAEEKRPGGARRCPGRVRNRTKRPAGAGKRKVSSNEN